MCCFPSSPVMLSPCPPRNTLAISFCCKDIDSISFYFCIYSPLDFILLYFCAKITIIFHISKFFREKCHSYAVGYCSVSLEGTDRCLNIFGFLPRLIFFHFSSLKNNIITKNLPNYLVVRDFLYTFAQKLKLRNLS